MIRIAIRAWVVCMTSLTVLPGCQVLSPFGGTSSVVAKDDRTHTYPVEFARSERGPISNDFSSSEPRVRPVVIVPTAMEPKPLPMAPLRLEPIEKSPSEIDVPAPVKVGVVEVGVETVGAKSALPQEPAGPLKDADPAKDKRQYAPLVKALQCILEGRHEEGIQHLNVYDKRTQEFLIGLLPIMDIFVRKGLDEMSTQEVAVLNSQLISLLATLRPRCELTIDRMCYCKQVRGFGTYDMLPGNHVFLSATKDRPGELVQMYVELKNFASEADKDGVYLTKLLCSLDLQNAKGESVWSHTYDRNDTTHRRRTRLNDFFSNYSFYVPELAPGEYKLTIRIVDETVSGQPREVRKSLGFRVTPVLNQTTLR